MLRIEFCTSKETIGSCIIRANQSTTRRNNNRNNMRIVEIRMRQSTCQLLLLSLIHISEPTRPY